MNKESGGIQGQDANPVVDLLIRESETELSRDEVEIIFNEEFSRLARQARIKGYLQLLSYRSTMERLRKQPLSTCENNNGLGGQCI